MPNAASLPGRVHFPNLNALRFLAAALVVVHHVEQFKLLYGLPHHLDVRAIAAMGPLGVLLFFVLSGFLITYLLLQERRHAGTISIRNFYIRRCLRIWPLYYLLAGLSLFVLPAIHFLAVPSWTATLHQHFLWKSALMMLLLSNVVPALFDPIPFASQTWSIGVEEQFYLIWPWLVKKAGNLYSVFALIIGGYILVRLFLWFKGWQPNPDDHVSTAIYLVWANLSFDCMAIGGLAALLHFERRRRILAALYTPVTQVGAYLLAIVLIAQGFSLPQQLHYPVFALLFGVIILNLACNPRSLLRLDNPPLNYLGKISYGLYMVHPLAIVITLKTLQAAGLFGSVAHYAASFLLTILIAALSYRFFERRFIEAKLQFSDIVSGDNVGVESAAAAPAERELARSDHS